MACEPILACDLDIMLTDLCILLWLLGIAVIESYNTLLVIYGFISEECKPETCTTMSAGSNYQYLWANEKDGKTEALSAPVYVEKLFLWVSNQLDDENIFSTSSTYGKNFMPAVKKILSRMFRVYAHIYYQHLGAMTEDNARANLDKCFRIFYYFIDTFKLVSEKEMLPLKPLIDQLN